MEILCFKYGLFSIITFLYLHIADTNSAGSTILPTKNNTQAREIVNPHPFTYNIVNTRLCDRSQTDVLIWVHTAPDHYRHRLVIRETWGNPRSLTTRKSKLVFFLGMVTNLTSPTQDMINYESQMYNDIVQETFVDSYRNLTYKAIAGFKWATNYCKSAKLILKTDDDMVVDINLLFRHIDSLRGEGKVISNTILCDVWFKKSPERNSGKWKITQAEYKDDRYPPYCPGLGLVMTADLIPKLYEASFYEPYFWIDDVYFTGLLGRNINVTFQQLASVVHFGSSELIRQQLQFDNEYTWMFYHIHHRRMSLAIWDIVKRREHNRQRQSIELTL